MKDSIKISTVEYPLVSIVMPAYNAGVTIEESIQSVLNQVYDHWELIIVDDGSTDNTAITAKNFEQTDKRIILLPLPKNGGLSNARNQACKIAKGAFVTFLDSDDIWHCEKLKEQVGFHLRNSSIQISHTDFHLFNNKGLMKRPLKYLVDFDRHKRGDIYPRICYRNPIGILTVMVNRKILEDANFFDTSLWTMEDQDLWVRIAEKGNQFGYIPKILAYYRVGLLSITSRIGRYKHAYKQYIFKMIRTQVVDEKLLYAYYYRHFGTVYFNNKQYRLSKYYFCKSIKFGVTDFISISSLAYLLLAITKSLKLPFQVKQ